MNAKAGPPEIREGVTDSQGEVLFTGVAVGDYAILIEPLEHARKRSLASVTQPSSVAFHEVPLSRGGSVVLEVVRSSGEAVPYHKVEIKPAKGAEGTIESYAFETDAAGKITAHSIAAGKYVAQAVGGEGRQGGSGQKEVAFEVSDDTTTQVSLRLEPLARLTVAVLEGGRAASGATVAVVPAGAEDEDPEERLRYASRDIVDPTGRKVYDKLEPGAYWVSYQRHDRPLYAYRRILLAGEENLELTVELPGGVLEGTVLGPHGEPLSRVRVTIARSLAVDRGRALWLSASLDGHQVLRSTASPYSAWTDSAGRFRIEGVPEGFMYLAFQKTGYGTGHQKVELRTGDRKTLRQQLLEPGKVAGKLRREDGTPIRGARIAFYDDALSTEKAVATARSSQDGSFTSSVAAGSYRVETRLGREQREKLTLSPTSPKASVEVVPGETASLELTWKPKKP